MAAYTCFVGCLRPGLPGSYDDGLTYYYPVYGDVLMLDDSDNPVMVGDDSTGPYGYMLLSSSSSFATADDLASLKTKLEGELRPQYPQLDASDTITMVYL